MIDKENGGKADALNVGYQVCADSTLLLTRCGYTLLERDALIRVVRPFLEEDATVAAGGIVRIANGCRGGRRTGCICRPAAQDSSRPSKWLST